MSANQTQAAAVVPSVEVSLASSARHAGIVKRANAYFIDPRTIDRREGWNPRFDFGEIRELANSIREELERDPKSGGLIQDIRVKRKDGGRFELIDGDRRLTAIELLLKEGVEFPDGVPAKVAASSQDDVTALVHMFTANTGKAFLPLEEAVAYKRMRDAGLTIMEISKKVGRSDCHVIETLALLEATPELKEAMVKGEVGSTMAKQIAVHARGNEAKQRELTAAAKSAGKDKAARRKVKQQIEQARQAKNTAKGRTLKPRAMTDDQLSELGAELAKALQAKMREARLPEDSTEADLTAWVAKDEQLVAAFTHGALMALKRAAGIKVNLDI